MNILITNGVPEHEVGGIAKYSTGLRSGFTELGHNARVMVYGKMETSLPPWIRHLYFLTRIIPAAIWADRVIALDTYSVGVPSAFASRLCGAKCIVRVGGDFLWGNYVYRSGHRITMSEFYKNVPRLSFKEKLIFLFTKVLVWCVDIFAFNTEWQKDMWEKEYKISQRKTRVIRNMLPEREEGESVKTKKFLWAGRITPVKNTDILVGAFEHVRLTNPEIELELVTNESHASVQKKLSTAYAAVLPSVSDVCPNFILEAASFNKPFITTKETGLNELLPHGGIFVDPFDQSALERAILELADETTYTTYATQLAKEYVPRSFKQVAEDFLTI